MRSGAAGDSIVRVHPLPDPTVRVVLDLEHGEPMSGWIAREGESATRFVGLLDLMSLLHRLRAGTGRDRSG